MYRSKKNSVRYSLNVHTMYIVLSYSNETWIFSTDFQKNVQLSNLTEICVAGAEFYHANGRTDMMNLIVAFRNFASPPKMLIFKNVTNEDANIKVTTIKKTHTQADQMHRAVWQAVSRTTVLQEGPREKLVLCTKLCIAHVLKCISLVDTELAVECCTFCCLATSGRNDARPSGLLPVFVTPAGTFSCSCYVTRPHDSISPNITLRSSSFFLLTYTGLVTQFFEILWVDFTRNLSYSADWLVNTVSGA